MRSYANPELRAILAEASQALTRLSADRLEAMAQYCEELVREPVAISGNTRPQDPETGSTDREMATLAQILDRTRANLQVLHRLQELRTAPLEYIPATAGRGRSGESRHGEH